MEFGKVELVLSLFSISLEKYETTADDNFGKQNSSLGESCFLFVKDLDIKPAFLEIVCYWLIPGHLANSFCRNFSPNVRYHCCKIISKAATRT